MKFWHEVDGLLLRQAADHADDIRDALIKTVPVDDIVNRWFDSRVAGEKVTPLEARDWANNNINLPEQPLKGVLDRVYATGWVMGDDVAVAAYANARYNLKKAAPSGEQMSAAINANWDNWKPGNRAAAALVKPQGALKKLLDRTNATVKEVNATTLNRIGTLLSGTLSTGTSADSLARALLRDDITASVVKDASRAQMIAVTEMSRALNTSTVDNYNQFGVEMVEWLAIDTGVCEICPANEAQGPIKLGEVFESGDEAPPAHPNCRCTILPVVDEGAADNLPTESEPDLSTPEMEISDVADHSIEDITTDAYFKDANYDGFDLPDVWPNDEGLSDAVSLYGGDGYRDMNSMLRSGELRASSEYTKKEIKTLNSSLTADLLSQKTSSPLSVYRGMSDDGFARIFGVQRDWATGGDFDFSQIKGSTFVEKGFMSTYAKGESLNTASSFVDFAQVTVKIDMPAGTYGSKFPGLSGENEFLLPPGSNLIVSDVERVGQKWQVNMTLTGQSAVK
jgi:SPP1 gp7 family putative phage head morphogenesis protein